MSLASLDQRARHRYRWIEYHEQITHKVAPTCRYFGISRQTFYTWYHRYLSLGISGLVSKSSRPHKIQRWLPKDICDTIIDIRLKRKYGLRPYVFTTYVRSTTGTYLKTLFGGCTKSTAWAGWGTRRNGSAILSVTRSPTRAKEYRLMSNSSTKPLAKESATTSLPLLTIVHATECYESTIITA